MIQLLRSIVIQHELFASVAPDTILCDSSTLTITVDDLNGPVHGSTTKVYQLTTSNPGGVLNVQPSGEYLAGTDIIDQLINPTNQVQSVTYHFKARIRDDRAGHSGQFCDQGGDTTITIYINPTARLSFTYSDPDTLLCNNAPWQREFMIEFKTTTISHTTGKVWYRVFAIPSNPDSITGYSNNLDNQLESIAPGHMFRDSLVNLGHSVEWVTYRFVPYIKNFRPGEDGCYGVEKRITIRVLPTIRANAKSDSLGKFAGGWDIRCHGLKTGKISLSRTGGYPVYQPASSYTYDWDGPGTFDSQLKDITKLYAGTYRLKVNDTYGCIGYDTLTLTEPDTLFGSVEILNPIVCAGYNAGIIRIHTNGGGTEINGGTGPEDYSIIWKFGLRPPLRTITGQSNDTLTGLTPSRYWAYLKDANNCAITDYEDLNGPDSVKVDYFYSEYNNVLKTNISCIGSDDGAFLPRLDGGTAPYKITVTGPDNFMFADSNIFVESDIPWQTNLKPGDYTVFAMDSNKCSKTSFITLKEPEPIINTLIPSRPYPGIDSININCFGNADGTVSPITTGGYMEYSYNWWSDDAIVLHPDNKNLDSLTAGTYYLMIRDSAIATQYATDKICYYYDTIRLIQPLPLIMTDTMLGSFIGGRNISCFDTADGTIDITLAGGIGNRSYTWSGSPSNFNLQTDQEDQAGLKAGLYHLRVDYGNSCRNDWDILLSQPDSLALQPVIPLHQGFEISCFDGFDGIIETSLVGGTGPYSYLWTTADGYGLSADSADQDSLSTGIYTLIATDVNGCFNTWTFRLDEPTPIISSIDKTYPITCSGNNVGGADITVTGGVPAYSYLWDAGTDPSLEDVRGLDSGMHYVRILDLNNCIHYDSAMITAPPPIVVYDTNFSYFLGYNVSCYGFDNGFIAVKTRGGFGNHSYSWSTSSSSDSIFNIPAGTYTLLTTDEYQCIDTATFVLSEPPRFMATSGVIDILCYDSITGSINLSPTGGVLPYLFKWSNDSTTEDLAQLPAGDYTLRMMDANLCLFDTLITVRQPSRIRMVIDKVLPFCAETEDGKLDITFSGGTPGYENSVLSMIKPDKAISYSYSSPVLTMESADAGIYKIHVVDSNGCHLDTTFFLGSLHAYCLNIPNTFTPNNDGDNEEWVISYGQKNPGDVSPPPPGLAYPDLVVQVFNRWGQKVFESEKGYPKPWNGTRNGNGPLLPIDSYYYLITINDEYDPITGVITIVY
ncbi:MAG: gliding motility-associated C-terminal domain-containing protein [Bacteroidales bacterium]